jgi:hypothetical protein
MSKFGPDLVADAKRIFDNVEKSESGCWEWTRSLDSHGYAQSRIGSRLDGSDKCVLLHRWVYERLVGPIPEGLVIDHLCENRKCLNPLHFSTVTALQNTARQDYSTRRRRSHCKYGHDMTTAWIQSNGTRRCRPCGLRHQRERRQRRRDEKI